MKKSLTNWADSLKAKDITSLTKQAFSFAKGAARTVIVGLFSLILIIVISIYMLLDFERLEAAVDRRFPPHGGTPLTRRIERALAGYVRGQVILSTVIGASAGFGMWVLGATGLVPGADKYALLFGLWTGIIEVIPYVGPWLAAVPPALYALVVHPIGVVWVAVLFVFIYQIEGHVVVPNVMANALRLHPLARHLRVARRGRAVRPAGRPARAADDGRAPRDLGVLRRTGRARRVGRRREARPGGRRARAAEAARRQRRLGPRSRRRHAGVRFTP